jgi:shikimate dehydrogenase
MKKLYGVIGDPIAHSMSPQMHNDLFNYYSIDAHYQPLLVKKEDLQVAISGLKAIGISGFNVTIPHKTTILPYLDEIDPLAKQIGAVNTVVNLNGKFIGYNTDGLGYVSALSSKVQELNQQNILIIGAGGAARGIYFSLAKIGVRGLDICNRTVEKAEVLIQSNPFKGRSAALSLQKAENQLERYNVIIQTTNIGMDPYQDRTPLSLRNIHNSCVVSDIIYNPLETLLLKEARDRGATIQNGVDMFVHQGALAFQYWTGIFPDSNRMKKILLEQLGGKQC